MPTPSAVLEAAKLLAEGCEGEPGYGELMVIDPGGATTDVHSIAEGIPTVSGIAMVNTLPEPYVKRTVEGNLGLKYNIDSLSEFTRGKNSRRILRKSAGHSTRGSSRKVRRKLPAICCYPAWRWRWR